MIQKKLKDRRFWRRTLFILKEVLLQALFPRACPVCGELLTLPKKWYRLLLPETEWKAEQGAAHCDCADHTPESLQHNPGPLSKKQIGFRLDLSELPLKLNPDSCRPLMICHSCYQSVSFLNEPLCRKCSRPLFSRDEMLCEECRRLPRVFDAGRALLVHDAKARKIIYDFKFRNRRDNAEFLAFEMALRAKEEICLWNAEVLIPVPLHKKRYRDRGFNQAQLLAEKISFWLERLYGIQIPTDSHYLLRCENTKPQRTLEASFRADNVRHAFTIAPQDQPSQNMRPPVYRSVILVDDIFTSGSTIDACSRTLKEAGCQTVYFLTASVV